MINLDERRHKRAAVIRNARVKEEEPREERKPFWKQQHKPYWEEENKPFWEK